MGLVDPQIGLVIWMLIGFLLLVIFLRKFAWKPIIKAVNDRENHIAESLREAERARQEVKNLTDENQKILKEARMERDNILKEAREIREKMLDEAKMKAKEEAEKILQQTRLAIENEKMAAVTELKNQVASMSIQIAEKILESELSSPKKQEELVEAMLKKSNFN